VEVLLSYKAQYVLEISASAFLASSDAANRIISSSAAACHTRFSEGNQVQTYMHARINVHAYSDI
jgi:hypothetical protein